MNRSNSSLCAPYLSLKTCFSEMLLLSNSSQKSCDREWNHVDRLSPFSYWPGAVEDCASCASCVWRFWQHHDDCGDERYENRAVQLLNVPVFYRPRCVGHFHSLQRPSPSMVEVCVRDWHWASSRSHLQNPALCLSYVCDDVSVVFDSDDVSASDISVVTSSRGRHLHCQKRKARHRWSGDLLLLNERTVSLYLQPHNIAQLEDRI